MPEQLILIYYFGVPARFIITRYQPLFFGQILRGVTF